MTPPLELPPSAIIVPQWIRVALGEIGVREDPALGVSTPRIEDYHAITMAGEALDDVPWCSSFWCWVMEMAGISSPKSKRAADWASWGQPCGLVFGATVLFPRSDADAKGSGHVAGLLGISGNEAFVIGGNQKNRVGIDVKDKRQIQACRWPLAVQLPAKKAT